MKKKLTTTELWDELEGAELFTYEELQLLTKINGYTVETLNSALYVRYGYRNLEQMKEEQEQML